MALTITIPGAVEATIGATAPAILTVGVGVPGATGATGATGAQGPQGDPGEGVPVGGTAGQVLAKIDGTNYNTEWVNVEGDYLPLAGGAMNEGAVVTFSNGSQDSEIGGWGFGVELTGTPTTYSTVEPSAITVTDGTDTSTITSTAISVKQVNLLPTPGGSVSYDSYANSDVIQLKSDSRPDSEDVGDLYQAYIGTGSISFLSQSWFDVDGSLETDGGYKSYVNTSGLQFGTATSSPASGTNRYLRTSIVFGDSTTQTTAFPGFNNAALTGNPTAPTPTAGDNDTSIATTAFVTTALAGGTAVARNLEVEVRNQSGSSIPAGSIVYISGATGNRPLITLSQANNDANSAQTMGFTKTTIANNAFGYVIVRGEVENLDTSAVTEGTQLYLSPTVAGAYTTTKPSAPQHLVYVGIVIRSHPNQGVILVAVQNGYELAEIHDVAIGTLANNDLLAYESSTDLWKNKTAATLGLAAINSQAFTGTPSLPTGTTGVTQSPGNNTTALATTAFVTAAVPAFATNVQAIAASSTTTALSPFNSRFSQLAAFVYAPVPSSLTSVTSGGGSSTMSSYGGSMGSSSSLAGYVLRHTSPYMRGQNVTGGIQWQKPQMFAVRIAPYYAWQTASIFRMTLGSNTATLNILANRGIGISFGASATNTLSALVLDVHNGTTLTSVTSSFTPVLTQGFDVIVYSDGAGNVTLYVNDVQVATTSAGPSTSGVANYNIMQIGIENTTTLTTGSNLGFNSLKTFIS